MADLNEIASLLKTDPIIPPMEEPRAKGKKRRAWLDEEEEKPGSSTGSIGGVDEPGLKDQNPIDQPGFKTRSINMVKPDKVLQPSDLRKNPLLVSKYLYAIADPHSMVTDKRSLTDISKELGISRDSVKTAVRVLTAGALISRHSFKAGTSGWSKYLLSNVLEKFLAQEKVSRSINPVETRSKVCIDSSINTTTNEEEGMFKNIDLSALESEGFSKNHLIQIFNEYKRNPDNALDTDVIQDSINALAYDLKHNDVSKAFKNPPAVVLTGMLKKGNPYASVTPDRYKSPKQEAMHRYLEMKEAERKQKKDFEQRMRAIAYDEWLDGVSEEELLSFCPEEEIPNSTPKIRKTYRRKRGLEIAKDYFEAEIWPAKKAELQKQFEGEPEHA